MKTLMLLAALAVGIVACSSSSGSQGACENYCNKVASCASQSNSGCSGYCSGFDAGSDCRDETGLLNCWAGLSCSALMDFSFDGGFVTCVTNNCTDGGTI
jgi:hypothetical protein